MKEPTMEEILELVEFERNAHGRLRVRTVYGAVWGDVQGAVYGAVYGDVWGDVVGHVKGNVKLDVWGNVQGKISAREWQYVETPKERAIRLIREGEIEEAIKVLEEE